MIVREDIVSVDDATHRVAWAIIGQQFHHYNGAAQVEVNDDGSTDFCWTVDLLPDEAAGDVDAMMDAGMAVIKRTMEQA